ncbi:MAG TPA: hypothetical protein VFV34_29525 [Blastocatellia bacterium]|nr:hypothetical protein [Blastocatellia bacterium]
MPTREIAESPPHCGSRTEIDGCAGLPRVITTGCFEETAVSKLPRGVIRDVSVRGSGERGLTSDEP